MKIFRCRICSIPYIGSEKPTHCPFCGSRQRHLVMAPDYLPTVTGELSEKSRGNLQKTLVLKVNNSTFYRGASKVADTQEGMALFQALCRLEMEHAAIVCRLLDQALPEELTETGECSPSHKENWAETIKRKERAVNRYGRYLEEATEERVQQVFEAFVEVHSDHLRFTV